MKNTGNRSAIDKNTIVIFGAGRIGRSFIGQLFGCGGYNVVFIDVDPVVISLLNSRGSYRVVIKKEKDQEIIVPNVSAIHASEREKVIVAVAGAGIMAVSVGKNALVKVIPAIASGLKKRYEDNGGPLDIILAENMRSAADFVRDGLRKNLPEGFPVDEFTGLIETSIGKMVPLIPHAELEKDPLVVFAEPYNTLILDGKGFRNPIPEIPGLAPKGNIQAWVDRKAFIHNLGHAASAYYGNFLHPDAVFMYEILEDPEVFRFTREVMLQSAEILRAAYPDEFTAKDLEDHIDDLIARFRSIHLQDTVFRVGQDLVRKLSHDDRFMGSVHLAIHQGMQYDKIIVAMAYGFFFRAGDEEGKPLAGDAAFILAAHEDFRGALSKFLGIAGPFNHDVISRLESNFCRIKGS